MKYTALALLIAVSLSSVSCAGRATAPSLTGTQNGAPVKTRSINANGGSSSPVKGTYLGRRYHQHPISKLGLTWTDIYSDPASN